MLHHTVQRGGMGRRYFVKYIKRLQRWLGDLYRVGLLSGMYIYTYTSSYLIFRTVSFLQLSNPRSLPYTPFPLISLATVYCTIFSLFFSFFFFKNRPYTDHIHTHNSTSPLYYYVNALYYRDNLSAERNTYFFFFTKISRKKFLRFTTFSYKF